MTIFKKKTYTPTPADITRIQQKASTYDKYEELIKLLEHKEVAVIRMAEDALQQLMSSEDEKQDRILLYGVSPEGYDGLIEKLEAIQSSNPDLKKVESILHGLKQDTATLRAERQEIKALLALLKEKGVSANFRNAKSLKALLEPDESIECVSLARRRGKIFLILDYAIYTNKSVYVLQGLTSDELSGIVTRWIAYDDINDVKETGVLIKKYRISGKYAKGDFSEDTERNDPILGQLAKYGTEEVKYMMKRLGLM